jgi:hypothetical protein
MMRIPPSQPPLLDEAAAKTNALIKLAGTRKAKDEAALFIRSTRKEVDKARRAEPLRHYDYNDDSVDYRTVLEQQPSLRQTISEAIRHEITSGESSRDRQKIIEATIVATCESMENDSGIIASHSPVDEVFQAAYVVERGELLLALKQAVASRPAALKRLIESLEETFVANRLLGNVKMAKQPSARPLPSSEAPT